MDCSFCVERRQEVVAPPPPSTTIPPIQNPAILPPCAANCGALFDANGACVPPFAPVADADTYEQCYCSQPGAAPFSTAISGVCDDSCASDGLSSIADWYRGLCNVENGGNNGGPTTTTTTTTGAQQTTTTTTTGGGSSDSDSDSSGSGGGSGGDW